MYAARTRSGKATTKATCVFSISAGHECCGLFVPDLYEAHALLSCAQSFHDSVDAVAGKTENSVNTPTDNSLDEHVGCCLCHSFSFLSVGGHAPVPAATACAPPGGERKA